MDRGVSIDDIYLRYLGTNVPIRVEPSGASAVCINSMSVIDALD